MLFATAAVSFRARVFPAWLGWLSLATAAAYLMLLCGIVVETGPLSPTGWGHLRAVPLVRRVVGVDDGCDGPPARHAAGRQRDLCHTPRAG
jgi:hypothetical protein